MFLGIEACAFLLLAPLEIGAQRLGEATPLEIFLPRSAALYRLGFVSTGAGHGTVSNRGALHFSREFL
jgi:hypothetical protein